MINWNFEKSVKLHRSQFGTVAQTHETALPTKLGVKNSE